MEKVADIYIEYTAMAVDQSFLYKATNVEVKKGMRVHVFFAGRKVVGIVNRVYEMSTAELEARPYKVQSIMEVIDDEVLLNEEAFHLARFMANNCVASLMSCFQAMLPSKLKPKTSTQHVRKETYVVLKEIKSVKGAKQQEAIVYLQAQPKVLRQEFNKKFSCLQRFIELGIVELQEEERRAQVDDLQLVCEHFDLQPEQQAAMDQIKAYSGHHVHLLHGVTGSGKTEIFLQLASEVLASGKQVLILVPEIGLTAQMVERVTCRFGQSVAIYHSSLNNQEKYEQYKLVKEKKVQIVVGTRSAVFMPFDALGLIVLDEEHDTSYKQDSQPRYHCRDIAIERARIHDSPIVLASATPSLESYARAYKGVYQLLELKNRIYKNMPVVHVVDMKENMKKDRDALLSVQLKNAIYERLEKKEQVILLLNRRGYSPVLRCLDCGEVKKCPHCDLTLNYHKQSNRLVCHYCEYQEPAYFVCSSCGSKNIQTTGFGTQKLEEYVDELFPQARVVRMDQDTMRRKDMHEKVLREFEQHEYDILVGTQMIAKGLDIPNVTLVGIVNADASLQREDFRSVELTFDLLVQASGRSGRGDKVGEVILQAYQTDHYAITCAKNQDYDTFFKKEMQFRHLGKYPPYTYLASLVFTGEDVEKLHQDIEACFEDFAYPKVKHLRAVELSKRKDIMRVRKILRCASFTELLQAVHSIKENLLQKKCKSKLEIDINPLFLE
ncbi:hypothetical protein A4S06_04195 [Erysipelotrichaceae bacterium MTC7]|nr:hypothetical protein A4S06_04195 [Erysipelotrichaceae bacterium MTC7]